MKWLSALLVLPGWCAIASGQSVQLPTFHQFSASSTIVVPDRGSVLLGGVNRSASGSNQFGGLPGSWSLGNAASASGVSVSVQIHDFEAMDRALLEEAARRHGRQMAKRDPQRFPTAVDLPSDASFSVAEIRRRRSADRPTADEVEPLLELARQAEQRGNPGAARVYLQMATRKSSGAIREKALAKDQRLHPATR